MLFSNRKRAKRAEPVTTIEVTSTDLSTCQSCQADNLMEWYVLACNCHVCCKCVVTAHCQRGCGSFRCPVDSCTNLCKSMQHCAITLRAKHRSPAPNVGDSNLIAHRSGVTTSLVQVVQPPSKEKDPIRYFQGQPVRYRKENSVISHCDYYTDTEDLTVTNHFPLQMRTLVPEQEKKIEQLALKLHSLLVEQDPTRNSVEKVPPILTPNVVYEMGRDDNSMLYRCMMALATGDFCAARKVTAKDDDGATFNKSRVAALAVAVSLIRRLNSRKPGPFQVALGSLLETHAASKTLRRFFSGVRLSASMSSTTNSKISSIRHKLEKGLNFSLLMGGLILIIFDNLGFRIRGAKAGYDQYTIIKLRQVTNTKILSRLEQMGINPEDPANIKRQEWEDVVATLGGIDKMLPTEVDETLLSRRHLDSLVAILSIAKLLPTEQAARELLSKDDRRHAVFGVGIPAEYGERRPVDAPTTETNDPEVLTTDVPHSEYDEEELVEEGPRSESKPTSYEVNDEIIDIPWTEDLAKTKTLELLHDYGKTLLEKARKDSELSTEEWEKTFFATFGVAAICDGSPAFGFSCLVAENQDAFTDFNCFFGGFHVYLELFKKKSSLLSTALLRKQFWSWRPSNKSCDYALFPGDPSQSEHECTETYSAVLHAASLATAKKLGRDDVSAVEVLDHMLNRAELVPEAFDQLIDCRLCDLLWMIRDSEKTGEYGCDPALFRTALKYVATLFATTNAYKYVRLMADFCVFWNCASEVDKAIYDSFIFTQETVNGTRIFSDRGMEWVMKDLRFWLGHHARQHQTSLLSRLTLKLSEKKKERVAGGEHASEKIRSVEPKEILISQVFAFVLCDQIDRNVWGDGPIRYGTYGKEYVEREGYFDPDGEHELVEDHLFWYSIGCERFKKYLNEYYVLDFRAKDRPGKKVSLRRLPTLKSEVSELRESDITFLTSTDIKDFLDLGKKYTKDDIRAQMIQEYCYLDDEVKAETTLANKSAKKFYQIECLVQVRKKVVEAGVDLLEIAEESTDSTQELDPVVRRRNELQVNSKLYCLSDEVRADPEYNERFTVVAHMSSSLLGRTASTQTRSSDVDLGELAELDDFPESQDTLMMDSQDTALN